MSELTERLRTYDKIEKPLADGPAVRGWNNMVRNQNEAADALEAQEARIVKLEKEISNHHEYLEFIERWAVYKSGPAEERLSVIAHYPPISAISKALTPSLPK